MATNTEERAELRKLKKLEKQEQGHGQWWKQCLCILLLASVIFMNLCMGSKHKESIIGITRCSVWYWLIQLVFVVECCIVTFFAVKWNNEEQKLKQKYNINFLPKDIRYEGRSLRVLLTLGFFGGWVSGALGLGGASIYNPGLLSLKVNPRVSGATSMYLVLYTTLNATIVNLMYLSLNLRYGVWLSFWSAIGSVIGLYLTDAYVKKSGKQSIFVWILVVVFIIAAIVGPIFGGLDVAS